jgi:hypothetical protein
MPERFDALTRSMAGAVSRREALRKVGVGMGAAFVAALIPSSALGKARTCPPGRQVGCPGVPCCQNGTTCCSAAASGGTAGCCAPGTTCCIVNNKAFCCPGLVEVCPLDLDGILHIGCLGV